MALLSSRIRSHSPPPPCDFFGAHFITLEVSLEQTIQFRKKDRENLNIISEDLSPTRRYLWEYGIDEKKNTFRVSVLSMGNPQNLLFVSECGSQNKSTDQVSTIQFLTSEKTNCDIRTDGQTDKQTWQIYKGSVFCHLGTEPYKSDWLCATPARWTSHCL